jgi:ketosteroid isomerase-like protein
MKSFFVPIPLAVSVLLGACGGGGDPSVTDPAASNALADTLGGLIEQAYDFESPGTLERMMALYAPGDEVVSASGGQITVSADSVRAGIASFWEQAGRNMRDARWTWDEVHAQRLGDNAAVLTGSWSIPHIAPDGQPHLIAGAWTAVFERVGGDWKIVHEHLSAPSP